MGWWLRLIQWGLKPYYFSQFLLPPMQYKLKSKLNGHEGGRLEIRIVIRL